MLLTENLNKGMGIARCICKTNAKLAINAEKHPYNVGRELAPAVFYTLFSHMQVKCS